MDDIITIDSDTHEINFNVTDEELKIRRANWKRPHRNIKQGCLENTLILYRHLQKVQLLT